MCNELRGLYGQIHTISSYDPTVGLLSTKSLVRVLPAVAYRFNTVPICDPSGLNSYGLVWETFTTPVRDFTPGLYYISEAGLTQNWAISQFVSKYTVLFLEPIRSLFDPFQVSHTIIGTSDSS